MGTMRIDGITVFNYVGSKRRMAGTLSKMIPKSCKVYAEAYCGGAALALNSEQEFDVKLLNDFNPHIANFWAVATNPLTSAALLEALKQTRHSQSVFMSAKERRDTYGSNRSDCVQWAVDTYILYRQSYSGKGEHWTYNSKASYESHLINPLGLALAFKKLQAQPFRVYNTNAVDFLEQEGVLDNPEAFIFLDPPYLEGLRCDGKLYQVDMPDVRDHIDLLKAIRQAKAKIVLSGYWSGRDDGTDLYDHYLIPYGWHRHLLGEYSKGCSMSEDTEKGAEWVWTNYDLKAEAPGALTLLQSYCDDEKSPCLQALKALQSTNN